MQQPPTFPLNGVIGIVANSAEEISLATASNLRCIEVRADLLLDGGLSTDDVMQIIQQSKSAGLAVLFTLRHPTHGGKFSGSEEQRASISRHALQVGADVVDLEWNTEAARLLQTEHSQLLLSYHDFNSMPSEAELISLTNDMCSSNPRAIKIVPTAATLHDSVRMLEWVATSTDDNIRRIGFAMGPLGECSRILTLAYGAPITYASFGEAVAPGQVEMDALLKVYRAMDLNAETSVIAVTRDAGNRVLKLNRDYAGKGENTVAIAFDNVSLQELEAQSQLLRISDILS